MNTANTSYKPHPRLKKPVVFIQKVPTVVHKEDLFQLFRKFRVSDDATITLTKASARKAKARQQVACIEFSSLDSAEKAMALLQHEQLTPHSNFPHRIYFALSKSGSPIKPSPAPLPRLFKYQDLNTTRIYDLLRPYGPIFSLKVEEKYRTVSVVFWEAEDADEAVKSLDQFERVDEVRVQLWSASDDSQSSQTMQSNGETILPSDPETGFAPILPESNDATSIPVTKSSILVPSTPVTVSVSTSFEHARTEESPKPTEPVHPSNDTEWHDVSEGRTSPSPQTTDIHTDSSVAEPEIEATSFSPSNSETTLVGSPTVPHTEDTSPGLNYSKAVQADPPQSNFRAPEKPSSTLDVDTAKNLASLVSNIWKEEAGRLRAEVVDLRVREGKIAEELKDSKAQESRIAKELNRSRARECRIAEELENEKVKREEESREAQKKIASMQMTISGLEWENEYLGKEKSRLQRQLDMQFEEKAEAEATAKEVNRLREQLRQCGNRELDLLKSAENLVERLQEAKEREAEKENTIAKLERQVDLSENKIAELERQLELSESRRKMLELEADKPKWEEARKKREMQQREKEAKEADRRKKQEEERRKQEERKKREDTERKRKEEQRRREEEEKLRQENAWREATAKEVERCRRRDHDWTPWLLWGTSRALGRFKIVMNGFEEQKFSSSCPMVLMSIPWPVLDHPSFFKLEQVQWDAVEKFFNAVQKVMSYADYKALVERAHKMFHPDRWRSRNVLSSVMDVEERDAFEKAGNRVSQAITPIWRNLRR
ncbi:hypothetical protein D9758_009491 [Tetrapyrgos nigripes]|uniref:RRM domain-containing protein n=1 Tax=Tetrapyrgos nigripes TaxID=182062 RepID=A0A8H5LFQ5_9AGAR|nr:hypothetical protein D9758_009491 [Tetrapyrgos nigripes]